MVYQKIVFHLLILLPHTKQEQHIVHHEELVDLPQLLKPQLQFIILVEQLRIQVFLIQLDQLPQHLILVKVLQQFIIHLRLLYLIQPQHLIQIEIQQNLGQPQQHIRLILYSILVRQQYIQQLLAPLEIQLNQEIRRLYIQLILFLILQQ